MLTINYNVFSQPWVHTSAIIKTFKIGAYLECRIKSSGESRIFSHYPIMP